MEIKTFSPSEYFGSNTYILISGREAAVIDPSVYYKTVLSHLPEGITFKYIIITHVHFDHIFCLDDWKDNTDAEVIVGVNDSDALTDSYLNCYRLFLGKDKIYDGPYRAVKEGESLPLGEETLTILDTPGHSKGSISILSMDSIFVGDTVFSKTSIGRTDLPGADYKQLLDSIRKIITLSPDTTVYPGHGEKTTVYEITN